jgi:hypothetical protein
MFPSNQATKLLLGMNAERLKEQISLFWKRINGLNSSDVNAGTPNKSAIENMANFGINIKAPGGTVVLSTGAHSAAQAGTINSVNTGQQQAVDLSPLISKLTELQTAIAELSSVKAKEAFTGHLQAAHKEVTDKDKPDVGIIKQSMEAIKLGGEAIEGGEIIVELCAKALPLLSLLTAVL